MDSAWGDLFAAAFSAAVFVKILDIIYQEFARRRTTRQTAYEFVDANLDPLLKAAGELHGKLRAMAENDFKQIHHIALDGGALENRDFASLIYLFGRFWARVEFIRHEGMSVAMGRDPRGAQLQQFFDCLESRRVRIIDRILQRAVGECFLRGRETISFVEFVETFNVADSQTRKWMMPLAQFLARMAHTSQRQRLLQYGAVVHALIDTLDPKHLVTRDRPAWPNKLTDRSWADLNYRVFGRYLAFVRRPQKYIGRPSGRPVKEKGRRCEGTLGPKPGTSVGPPLFR
jgi:hypothetical protein